jgi:hypothetical protein
MKLSYGFLFLAVILTGLGAGLGFANAVGYMPAFEDTPADHALSFWQHADHYFRARMPFFGNGLLLSLLLSLLFLRKEWQSPGYWMVVLALLASIVEMIVIFTQNLPINIVIEKLDVEKLLPLDFEELRQKAMRAFYIRSFLNLVTFLLTLTGAFYLFKKYFQEEVTR